MFFKVSDKPEQHINTDNIDIITFQSDHAAEILFTSRTALKVRANTARALLEFVETNASALDYDPTSDAPQLGKPPNVNTLPLTSRIAQQLRDGAPSGMALGDLIMMFDTAGEGELITALDALVAERVVMIDESGALLKYFHASNAPGRSTSQDF